MKTILFLLLISILFLSGCTSKVIMLPSNIDTTQCSPGDLIYYDGQKITCTTNINLTGCLTYDNNTIGTCV